jgi:hypothetical protein
MHFLNLQIALTAFAALTTATAIPSSDLTVETNSKTLAKRSDHEAHFYTELGCSSGLDAVLTDFSCGGTCHTTSKGWESIYLQYSGKGAKPTVSCFTSGDCAGSVAENTGIAIGTTSCTAQHDKMYSCYVYYNC